MVRSIAKCSYIIHDVDVRSEDDNFTAIHSLRPVAGVSRHLAARQARMIHTGQSAATRRRRGVEPLTKAVAPCGTACPAEVRFSTRLSATCNSLEAHNQLSSLHTKNCAG